MRSPSWILLVAIFGLSIASLGSAAASAYTVTATLNTTSSAIANGYTVNGDGTVTVDFTPGDIIAIDIWASNAVGDTLQAAFTSISHKPAQSIFLGGGYVGGPIFAGSCSGSGCTPPALNPIGSPQGKASQPYHQGTSGDFWIQTVSHGNQAGTDGTGGPGLGDYVGILGFEYVGVGGFDAVTYEVANLPGDSVSGPNGLATVEIYNSLCFNVPEPGTALLIGLGLAALGATGRRASTLHAR